MKILNDNAFRFVVGYIVGFVIGVLLIIYKCWIAYASNYTFIEYLKTWAVK